MTEQEALVEIARQLKRMNDRPEPRHGRWIEREEWFEFEPKPRKTVGCSECGHSMYSKHDTLNYCPKCGARMDGGEDV